MAKRRHHFQTEKLVSDYEGGMSALALSKREGCSIGVILSRLREAGVEIRAAGQRHTTKELLFSSPEADRFQEFVDGLLLGDGSINKAGALQLNQRIACAEWLQDLSEHCEEMGVANGITPPRKRKPSFIHGRKVQGKAVSTFYTHTYKETKEHRLRWYPDDTKRLPEDLVVSPLSVAFWYCGDGTGAKTGTMSFATHSFTDEEVETLAQKLSDTFGVRASRGQARDGPILGIYRRDDSMRIKTAIEKYVPKCFSYKLQHVRAAIPRGRALRRLTPTQVRQIRKSHAKGVSAAELGRRHGVSNVSIINAVSRRTYKDVE